MPVNSAANGSTRTAVQNVESKPNEGNAIGRMVSGVIDGYFDAGFLVSVQIGSNGPLRRGVIFEPGRFAPLTCSNDIAPQAKMIQRRDATIPIPIPGQQNQINNVGSRSVMKQPAQLGLQQQSVVLPQVLPSVPQPGSGSGSGSGSSSGLGSPRQLMNHSQPPSSTMPIGNTSNNNMGSPTLAEKNDDATGSNIYIRKPISVFSSCGESQNGGAG